MRTTNKLVIEKLQNHVLDNFTPENYGGGVDIMQNLIDQIDLMRKNNMDSIYNNLYKTALDYVEGGSLLVYYYDVQKFLKDLLHSDREYSDDKAWKLYCHLCARTIANLYSKGVK